MTKKDPIVIVVACDNHYMPLLAGLIKSIDVNHKTEEKIYFYILDDGISRKNRIKLEKSVTPGVFTIHWLEMDRVIPEGMSIPYDNSSYPLIIHMRMFIPYFIPKEYEKVIYMDVDMIVNADISGLWNTDLQDYTIAAVIDVRIKEFASRTAIRNYKELGFDGSVKYFNTGLIIMNTKKWRDNDLSPKIFKCIDDNREFANYPDQYGLNVIFANNWLQLDTRWSWSAEEWNPDAFLVHFIWRKPIYKTYMFDKRYQEMFFRYLSMTEWKGFVPITEFRRLLKKSMNKLLKLPLLLKSK
jgi:lipopolysaccharide biosynthesis glycosyltransferase